MSESTRRGKHTPGPWRINRDRNIEAGDGNVIRVCGVIMPCGYVPDGDEGYANARLIAAAPELLDSLKDALKTIEASDHWWMDCPDKGGFNADTIRAAIAKAEGTAEGTTE
jgi:hypothetical protein